MPKPLPTALIDALHAGGPAPERADKLALYGWLVGSWSLDAVYHLPDGGTRAARGEVHAGWALEGRAIQDVWIVPPRGTPRSDPPFAGEFYGTTLRIYDPGLDAWHILWSDPVRQVYCRQLGRAQGPDIVQEGKDDTGDQTRWSFREITTDSFLWRGERRPDAVAAWRLEVEFRARRLA